jgi:XTP/dITP diphosphohydrolase
MLYEIPRLAEITHGDARNRVARLLTLYIATTNAGKLREFANDARAAGVEVLPLPGLNSMPEPIEDAATFMGNAEIKARTYSLALHEPGALVLADDSGLEVAALVGAPGVRSARFAEDAGFTPASQSRDVGHSVSANASTGSLTPHSRTWHSHTRHSLTKDDCNNALLLERLKELQAADKEAHGRSARYVCALAVARDGEILLRAEGTLDGEILDVDSIAEGRGTHGFGYDPFFLLPSRALTAAELAPEAKWQHSHRGRAFRALLAQISADQL